jgi:topoisomerase-4 subunit A
LIGALSVGSEDKPKPVLMERFGISDIQAEAVLELKLRHLAKLEEMAKQAISHEIKVILKSMHFFSD